MGRRGHVYCRRRTMLRARQYALAAAVAGSLGFAGTRSASAQFAGGQFGQGNTWNVYEFVTTPAVTWDQARVASNQRTFTLGAQTFQGHLVTILSVEENTFVNRRAPGDAWIGLTDSDQTSQLDNFNPGGTEAGTNPNGGWKWVTGEAFSY